MKLTKKIINFSLIFILCLSCFGLVACNIFKDDESDNTLTLAQVKQICDTTFDDLQTAQNLAPASLLSASSDVTNNVQTSPIGISYSDYSNTIPANAYGTAEDLIDMIEINYQIFKTKDLYLNTTFEYKMIGDDEGEFWYIYLNISALSTNQVRLQWAQTQDSKSNTYNGSLLYQSMLINVDNNLNWTSVEVQEFKEENYGGDYPTGSYYYIEKSTSNTRKYDRYTEATTDYNYIDINEVIEKSITLDCSAETELSDNQIKAKNYINSLNLTNSAELLQIFKSDIKNMGTLNVTDL